MPTVITRYVNTDSTSGGDGTTNNTSGATRAFATLGDAATSIQTTYTSFVASDVQVDVICSAPSGVADAATYTTYGVEWNATMDATRYIRVLANTGHEAVMPWSTSRYRLQQTSSYYNCMTLHSGKVVIEGLQMENTGADRSFGGSIIMKAASTGAGTYILRRCHARMTGTGTPYESAAFLRVSGDTASTFIVENCAAHDMASGISITDAAAAYTLIAYSNTFVNNVKGFDVYDSPNYTYRLKNNLCSGNTTADYGVTTFTLATTSLLTNLSSDATSPNSALRNKTVTFVSSTDWHLASSDASAQDAGTDLSADPYNAFSTDFDNVTRSGTWDVGADEYIAAGGATALFSVPSPYRVRR